MTEPKISNYYKVATLLFEQGLPVTNRELDGLIKEYNDWKMPISKRIIDILENKENFINFVRDNKK